MRGQVFEKVFETAEIAKFTSEEAISYEDSLKYYRDLKNSWDTAREEGRLEEKIIIAKKALQKGLSTNEIIDLTGLSSAEINRIKLS